MMQFREENDAFWPPNGPLILLEIGKKYEVEFIRDNEYYVSCDYMTYLGNMRVGHDYLKMFQSNCEIESKIRITGIKNPPPFDGGL